MVCLSGTTSKLYVFQRKSRAEKLFDFNNFSFNYAPLEKGGILFCNCRSVGMSVCRSVDQVLSGQYLLTPSLDQYQ